VGEEEGFAVVFVCGARPIELTRVEGLAGIMETRAEANEPRVDGHERGERREDLLRCLPNELAVSNEALGRTDLPEQRLRVARASLTTKRSSSLSSLVAMTIASTAITAYLLKRSPSRGSEQARLRK
jgi:hypothetical protein